jgi:copper chaperone
MARESHVFGVQGMSCGRCETSIKLAVGSLAGVDKVDIELRSKLVTVDYDAGQVDLALIKEAIEEQGFDVD